MSMSGTSAPALPPSAVSLRPTPLTEMYLRLNGEYDACCYCHPVLRATMDMLNAVAAASDCINRRECARAALL